MGNRKKGRAPLTPTLLSEAEWVRLHPEPTLAALIGRHSDLSEALQYCRRRRLMYPWWWYEALGIEDFVALREDSA